MIVDGVDPPEACWEDDTPAYRVYFWHQPPAPPGVRQEQVMYSSDEYRLQGAVDVQEVLAWVSARARPDQTFTLYAEHQDEDGVGLLRLSGVDPTERD